MNADILFGSLLWLISSACLLLAAWRAHRLVRVGRPSLDLMSFVFMVMFCGTLGLLIMGVAGLLAPIPITVAAIVVVVVLVAAIGPSRFAAEARADWASATALATRWWGRLPLWMKWVAGIATAVSTLRFAFLIWSLPPFVWDSLTYHMTNVAHWTQAGRIELFDVPVTRIYAAANYELWTTWFTVFIHQDTFIEAGGIAGYLLGVLAVYSIARTLGTRRHVALLAAFAYGSTPALLLPTTGTKNDPQMAGLFLAMVAMAIDHSQAEREEATSNPLGRVLLPVLVLCYAIGTKAYILYLIPSLVVIAVGTAAVNGTLANWTKLPRQVIAQFRSISRLAKVAVMGIVLAGLLVGAYWNTRNWILTGNPVYPFGFNIGESQIIEAPGGTTETSLQRMVENLQLLAERFWDWRLRIKPDLPLTTGWGWFAYGVGLPATIWAAFRRPKIRIPALGLLLALLTMFLSIRPSDWNMRYIIWFPAVFSLGFAAFYEWLDRDHRLPALGIAAMTVFNMAMNLSMTLNYNQVSLDQFAHMLSLPTAERDAARLGFSMPQEYVEALDLVPRDQVLGFNVNQNGFIYPFYRADFSQQIAYVPVTPTDTCESIADSMEQRNTRWLVVAPVMTPDAVMGKLHECNEAGTRIRERASNIYVLQADQ